MNTDIEDRLEVRARAYNQARDLYEHRQAALHELVREARDEGLTLRRIAELTGLSFGRVHQLTKD